MGASDEYNAQIAAANKQVDEEIAAAGRKRKLRDLRNEIIYLLRATAMFVFFILASLDKLGLDGGAEIRAQILFGVLTLACESDDNDRGLRRFIIENGWRWKR